MVDDEVNDRLGDTKHNSDERNEYESAHNASFDLLHDIRDCAAFEMATSPEGALFHITVAADLIDQLLEYTSDERVDGKDAGPSRECRIRQLERKIDCVLWSVRDVFEKLVGIKMSDYGCDFYMPRDLRKVKPPAEILEYAEERIKFHKGEPNKLYPRRKKTVAPPVVTP